VLIKTKASGRPITMWKLLVWAYKRHMVQYERDRAFVHHNVRSRMGGLIGLRGSGGYYAERGCINGAGTTAHEDAHLVHAYVRSLDRAACALVIDTASREAPPEWSPYIPPLRVVPVRKGGGNLRMMRDPRSHRAIGCYIEYVGVPDDEAAAILASARKLYRKWWDGLSELYRQLMDEDELTLWHVVTIGAEPEPWLHRY
jgi:hypothetical protein